LTGGHHRLFYTKPDPEGASQGASEGKDGDRPIYHHLGVSCFAEKCVVNSRWARQRARAGHSGEGQGGTCNVCVCVCVLSAYLVCVRVLNVCA